VLLLLLQGAATTRLGKTIATTEVRTLIVLSTHSKHVRSLQFTMHHCSLCMMCNMMQSGKAASLPMYHGITAHCETLRLPPLLLPLLLLLRALVRRPGGV
jgi:hypothetical protein